SRTRASRVRCAGNSKEPLVVGHQKARSNSRTPTAIGLDRSRTSAQPGAVARTIVHGQIIGTDQATNSAVMSTTSPVSRQKTCSAEQISPSPSPRAATSANPSRAEPSAAKDGVHPQATAAASTIAKPGSRCTHDTSRDATGNSSRGRYTFRTSGAFPSTEWVVLINVSLKNETSTSAENMKIGKCSTRSLIPRKTPATKKNTAKCAAGRT